MQENSYRSGFYSLLAFMLAGLVLVFLSCKKEPEANPPQIEFISGPGYLDHDTSLVIGDHVLLGLNASSSGSNITFFQVTVNNGTRNILLDSGLNSAGLSYQLKIIKSSSAYERWTFLVMDRDRNKDSVSIFLGKSDSSHYGKIKSYTDFGLGAQENTTAGSFFSFTGGEIYIQDTAFLKQALTDLIYYYGQYEATLSSPNEAEAPSYFTGPTGIANWTIKNETRYDTTSISSQSFDEALNDSLLLAAYEPTAGKRKAKYVVPGMVISFISPAGKIGLVNIKNLEPGPAGIIRLSLKIQE